MKKATKVVALLGATAALGALFGILYAPDKGTRTRRKLSRQYGNILHKMDNKINERKDQIEAFKERMQDQVDRLQDKIKRLS